ncbi:sensor histidine kinase [Cytophaga aurantiaca]|uniref:sensor histidine kinase n=1 Tax=Cytophaga aurantiaca TaxID=29530 RepID=UPI00038287EE|nr:ATP-binding protein [Cytophaga aurantiaca]
MILPVKPISSFLKVLRWVILALAVSLSFLLFFKERVLPIDQSIYYSVVSNRIQESIEDAEIQSKLVIKKIHEGEVTFSQLNKVFSPSPFYIFEGGKPIYWSNAEYIPSYKSIRSTEAWSYVSNSSGKYLVYRDTLISNQKVLEVFFLLELERIYSVDNAFINSHTNQTYFKNIPVRLFTTPKFKNHHSISVNNKYLCSFECASSSNDYLYGTITTGVFVLVVFLIWLYFMCDVWMHQRSSYQRILIRILSFVLFRTALLELNLPEYFSSHQIFSSEYYASSFISQSIFDLVLNVFCSAYLLFELIIIIQRKFIYRYIYLTTTNRLVEIKVLLSSLLTWSLIISYYYILKSIVKNSTVSLNLIDDLDLSIVRVILVFAIIAISFIFFYIIHLNLQVVWRLHKRYRIRNPKRIILVYLILIAISWFIEPQMILVSVCLFIFAQLSLLQGYPSVLGKMKYQSFIYIFLFCLSSSLIIGAVIFFNGRNKVTQQMTRYGERLLYDRDEITEFLLQEASFNIQKDEFIREKILSPFSDLSVVKDKIQKKYLSNYFNDYSVRIELLDATGEAFNSQTDQVTYNEYYNTVLVKSTYLNKLDLYSYVDHITNTRRYISVNKIKASDIIIAYIIIELESGKYSKNSVFPELVLDQKQVQENYKDFDYCIFDRSKIETSYGYFNYDQKFLNYLKLKEKKQEKEFRYEGYYHVLLKGEGDAWIVVSKPYGVLDIMISNASIYFLFHIVGIFIIVLIHVYRINSQKRQVSYATKVQIYLNLAFFIPLLLVSLITLGFVNRNYEQTLLNRFISDSDKLSALISSRSIVQDRINKAAVTELLLESDLTRVEQLDINIYSNNGSLLATNQSEVFRKGILSSYIQPDAIAALLESRNQYIVTNGQAGSLSYKSIYRLIRVPGTGAIAGIIHLPFFESKEDVVKQISTYLKIILNIFSIGFIVLLLLSYLVAYYLTYPLKLITQGIKKTGLYDNEPIQWQSSDEIGRLVQEYNSMLIKIDESKSILANSEKESAWREMARQVAHEIKNPLTPMKLKLQYLLQRLNHADTKPSDEELKQSFRTILTQVDSLSEIASSFSSFYKLPELQLEKVELNHLVKELAVLHQETDASGIYTHIPNQPTVIVADKKMVVNILNNLLLNAIQSIPEGRLRNIDIFINQKVDSVLIEIKDNGSGIPVELQHKIFVPYFSTKYSGSGIGLALAKRLVEDMKGAIWFETSLDKGTSFYIEMPYYTE